MDFTIRLRAEGTAETRAQADAVRAVRTEIEKSQKATAKQGGGADKIKQQQERDSKALAQATDKANKDLEKYARDSAKAAEKAEIAKIDPESAKSAVEKARDRVAKREASAAKRSADAEKKRRKEEAAAAEKASLVAIDPRLGLSKIERAKIKVAKDAAKEKKELDKKNDEEMAARIDPSLKKLSATEKAKEKLFGKIGTGVMLAGAAAGAAIVGITSKLAPLALGYMGMARLSMISAQASFNMRRLFVGTNPKPLLDALQRTGQLIDPRTFTGKTIGDFLVRSSNSFFNMLAKAEPYARLFFKGMVNGALQVEIAWLKLRIAIQPALNLIPDGIGLMTSFEAGALAVKAAFGLMGVGIALGAVKAASGLISFGSSALVATAPLLPFAAAIGGIVLAVTQLKELMDAWDENSFSQITTKLKGDLGFASKEETEAAMSKRQGITTGDDYDKKFKLGKYAEKTATPTPKGAEKQAATAGPPIGKNLGLGVLAGMKDVQGKVEAGGRDLVLAAEGGAKKEAEIRSPAAKWRREIGRQLGAGAALGLEDSADRIDEAARAAVPSAPSVSGSAGRRSASVVVQQIGPFFGVGADIEATIRRVVPDVIDDMAERMGALA